MPQFKQSVIDELQYYVYCLVDPRTHQIFYIGKGYGNRIFMHLSDALADEDRSTLKLDTIRDIMACGYEVEHYIIRHKLTEEQAYLVESTLINLLTFSSTFKLNAGLTNIQAGHHQWDEGIKSVQEINALYNCSPLTILNNDKLIAVKLNRTYRNNRLHTPVDQPDNIYEKTRKYWRVNIKRAQKADYVLAVYKGIVRAVFKPLEWYPVTRPELFTGTRYAFDGIEVPDSPYLNTDVSAYITGQSPVRYINF